MIRAVITDIEGTTTSVSFVYEVLFPYAHSNLAGYIHSHQNQPAVREQLELVRREVGQPLTDNQIIRQLLKWMDEDKKITPLKTLQGLIWEHGYRQGDFKGHVYDDVPPMLQHWHQQGIGLYVYSSGSVQAQKLLFGYSNHGDLTGLFSDYFDTRIGNKRESGAYEKITRIIELPPAQCLFLSDVVGELEAADNAGMQTMLLVRDGNKAFGKFPVAHNFNEIDLAS